MKSIRRRLLLLLLLIPIVAALYVLLREPTDRRGVRFALYRPADAVFYVDRGATPGDSLDYAHDPKDIVRFGVPGDIGLVCPQKDREDPHGYRVFAQGLWFLSGKTDRPPKGDLGFGQPGDLPFCADFNGDGLADSGVFRDGAWLIATKRAGMDADIQFSLGTKGDRPVVLNVTGAGNATDRNNVVYGVYRQGKWFLDTKGSGAVDATHDFGGLPQDLPLLIPRWSQDAGTRAYSLAIFRDGTWFIRPDPDGAQTLRFTFGAPGDFPGFVR
ncbi:MAG: hypothetical protein ABI569_00300 [Casimicrobiaceae bacterium]